MAQNIRHLRRLFVIARTLARHDALFPLEMLSAPPLLLRLARLFAWFVPRAPASLSFRPGERLAEALYELGPSFIKLGQALSVRPDLVGDRIAEDLGRLRDRLPPFPTAVALASIETELGQTVAALFQQVDDPPIAAASIAQVHFAVTSEGRDVAIKILRPGIEQAFARDLDLFFWLADLAARAGPRLQRLRPRDVVQTLADSVRLEMDLRMEAAAAAELAANFVDDPDFQVPRIDWLRTGQRVMTIERVTGISINDREALLAAGHDLPKLAANVIRTFLNQALRDGFFHADLHQGNLFVAADGALVPVDFGIMGRLDRDTRRFMADMLLAFVTGDYRRAAEVHFTAGYVPDDKSVDAFAQACRSIGEPILGRPVAEISIARLLAQLFRITETFAMETQPQLLLLQKTMVTAEGVARGLDPAVNFWTVSQPVIEGWMRENMGPEARLREAAGNALDVLQRLPRLANRIERAADCIASGDLQLPEASLRLLAAAQAQYRRPLVIAAWAIVALLALLLVG